ncbi:MAG: hypothetical protein WCK02_09710 [Bacteroidota bacterium]
MKKIAMYVSVITLVLFFNVLQAQNVQTPVKKAVRKEASPVKKVQSKDKPQVSQKAKTTENATNYDKNRAKPVEKNKNPQTRTVSRQTK